MMLTSKPTRSRFLSHNKHYLKNNRKVYNYSKGLSYNQKMAQMQGWNM